MVSAVGKHAQESLLSLKQSKVPLYISNCSRCHPPLPPPGAWCPAETHSSRHSLVSCPPHWLAFHVLTVPFHASLPWLLLFSGLECPSPAPSVLFQSSTLLSLGSPPLQTVGSLLAPPPSILCGLGLLLQLSEPHFPPQIVG